MSKGDWARPLLVIDEMDVGCRLSVVGCRYVLFLSDDASISGMTKSISKKSIDRAVSTDARATPASLFGAFRGRKCVFPKKDTCVHFYGRHVYRVSCFLCFPHSQRHRTPLMSDQSQTPAMMTLPSNDKKSMNSSSAESETESSEPRLITR